MTTLLFTGVLLIISVQLALHNDTRLSWIGVALCALGFIGAWIGAK